MSNLLSTERIIGHYRGEEPGPFVIAIGGQHGNEPAGVRALEQVFELLAQEPSINPGFVFKGELLALRGNLPALAADQRYLEVDQNRLWLPERISWPEDDPRLCLEDRQIREILDIIEIALEESGATEIAVIDLHTTTAEGGIFVIPGSGTSSAMLAAEMYVPVVRGLLDGLLGTSLHFFQNGFLGDSRDVRALTFEAGSHYDPRSVDLAVAATLNLLRALGCVEAADVRTLHDELLREYGKPLPRMTRLAYVHRISSEDDFQMLPGFQNFHAVKAGTPVGQDSQGYVHSPKDGYLLMPLYQAQGQEGFFVVEDEPAAVAF
ncbi:MAG: succinylglutamate desuccinylase/aspartoacylase family protein [Bacteroidota bacterium]